MESDKSCLFDICFEYARVWIVSPLLYTVLVSVPAFIVVALIVVAFRVVGFIVPAVSTPLILKLLTVKSDILYII
jgi:hypothetical protein